MRYTIRNALNHLQSLQSKRWDKWQTYDEAGDVDNADKWRQRFEAAEPREHELLELVRSGCGDLPASCMEDEKCESN